MLKNIEDIMAKCHHYRSLDLHRAAELQSATDMIIACTWQWTGYISQDTQNNSINLKHCQKEERPKIHGSEWQKRRLDLDGEVGERPQC